MQGVKTRMVWGNAVGECYGEMLWGNVVGKCVQSIGEGWGVGARHQQRRSLRGLCSCNQKGGLDLPPCAHGNICRWVGCARANALGTKAHGLAARAHKKHRLARVRRERAATARAMHMQLT